MKSVYKTFSAIMLRRCVHVVILSSVVLMILLLQGLSENYDFNICQHLDCSTFPAEFPISTTLLPTPQLDHDAPESETVI